MVFSIWLWHHDGTKTANLLVAQKERVDGLYDLKPFVFFNRRRFEQVLVRNAVEFGCSASSFQKAGVSLGPIDQTPDVLAKRVGLRTGARDMLNKTIYLLCPFQRLDFVGDERPPFLVSLDLLLLFDSALLTLAPLPVPPLVLLSASSLGRGILDHCRHKIVEQVLNTVPFAVPKTPAQAKVIVFFQF
jgi:hypothetical protein